MKTVQNNPALQKRLLGYTAMASLVAATGVGVGAQPAAAQPQVVAAPNATIGAGETFDIDFDGNSLPEFVVYVTSSTNYTSYTTYTYGFIDLRSFNQSVSFLGQPGGFSFLPYALNQGDPISATAGNWSAPTSYATLTTSTGTQGYWINLTGSRYVGVRYVSGGETRYGWVELTVTDLSPGPQEVTIHRYGHNTTAGEAIPAAVDLIDVRAGSSPLRAAGAAALTAVAGALTWLRLRLPGKNNSQKNEGETS